MATKLIQDRNNVSEFHLTKAIAGAREKYPGILLEKSDVRDAIFEIQRAMSEAEQYNFHNLKSSVLTALKYVGEIRAAMTSALTRYFQGVTDTPIRRAVRLARKKARLLAKLTANDKKAEAAWCDIVARNEHILTPDGEPVDYWPDYQ